jgi:predicted  nucleic acid-binding Zn-ribbon protein
MPQTSSPQLQQLHDLSAEVRDYVSENLMPFLEEKHTEELNKKMNSRNAVISVVLQPVEAFELEVKNKLSNAAHEILQCINRIEDSQKQDTVLDVTNFLRYARLNLEEAEKDIEAANSAWNSLNMYASRIEKQDGKLATAVNGIAEQLINMLEQTKNYRKELYEKILMALNAIIAG